MLTPAQPTLEAPLPLTLDSNETPQGALLTPCVLAGLTLTWSVFWCPAWVWGQCSASRLTHGFLEIRWLQIQ